MAARALTRAVFLLKGARSLPLSKAPYMTACASRIGGRGLLLPGVATPGEGFFLLSALVQKVNSVCPPPPPPAGTVPSRGIFVEVEATPNPDSLKFVPNEPLMEDSAPSIVSPRRCCTPPTAGHQHPFAPARSTLALWRRRAAASSCGSCSASRTCHLYS